MCTLRKVSAKTNLNKQTCTAGKGIHVLLYLLFESVRVLQLALQHLPRRLLIVEDQFAVRVVHPHHPLQLTLR